MRKSNKPHIYKKFYPDPAKISGWTFDMCYPYTREQVAKCLAFVQKLNGKEKEKRNASSNYKDS